MAQPIKPRGRLKPLIQDEMEVNIKDRWVKFSGLNPGLLLIILVILYFAFQLVLRMMDTPDRQMLERVVTSISQEHKTLHDDHKALVETQERIADAVEINTFLNTKTDRQKQEYRLDEPKALRRHQAGRD